MTTSNSAWPPPGCTHPDMNHIVVGADEWIVPKESVDYEMWNWLNGVDDPYRLGRFATAPRRVIDTAAPKW
jgi:hypothetical protein